MSDLRDLYQEVILDHSKRPHNFRSIENPMGKAEGYNPLCGDKFTVYLQVADGVVRDVSFEGSGCAISKASASMMTEALRGKTLAEVEAVFKEFQDLVMGRADGSAPAPNLGKLAVFSGVSEFPVRVKCATLAWHTMKAALDRRSEPVTTE
jgi:nitrogen fixation NifU-like protein